ncbi:uncharacterized protein [Triticum aestivum]|uniref:uncharacterized protein n=1 Tax=Triticum aestivum TaxID=4565 RepID=UPI001D0327C4|nr:uncharacterized protein LOC123089214 [Triticum aestivum]
MGNFILHVAVVWTLLLLAGRGTNAARVRFHRSSSETSLLEVQGLLGQVSPSLHTESSSVMISYLADHLTKASDQGYYDFVATMDVYGFNLSTEQSTSASVHLFDTVNGAEASLNVIQIGWEVDPKKYGDSHTHLGVLWTADGFQKTGCRNADCAVGFQPEKGAPIAPGGVIKPVSQPMGLRQTITVKIIKEGIMGDWLVYYGLNEENLTLLVRFPKSLFNGGMANRAAGIQFGGQVLSPATALAPMGSGYRPMVDVMASASMSNIQLIDQNGRASPMTDNSLIYMSDSHVYPATPIVKGQFFYGGPMKPSNLPDWGRGLPRATSFLGNQWWFVTLLVGYCLIVH